MESFKSKTPFKNTMINCNSYKKSKGRANEKPLWHPTYLFMLVLVHQTVFLLQQYNNKQDKKWPQKITS